MADDARAGGPAMPCRRSLRSGLRERRPQARCATAEDDCEGRGWARTREMASDTHHTRGMPANRSQALAHRNSRSITSALAARKEPGLRRRWQGREEPAGRGSSRCTCRRAAAGLVENAGVARLRRRASNENTVPLETVPRSKQCPNTEPRQDDGALHDSRRHGAALSHSATLSHGAAFPRTQPSHTAPLAALRSRLPPSRPYGCERPCRWC
jgi:hypothetical protein